jgi:elongation factor Ts
MSGYTAKDVQRLRQLTGCGMLDAKRALDACDGDFDEAAKWLRVQGLASSAKRADREAAEGAVAAVREGNVAALVSLRCETDFVAKAPEFVELVGEIAARVAEDGEDAVAQFNDEIDRLNTTLKENISLGQVVRLVATEDQVVDTYLHLQSGRGKIAVGIVLEGGTEALAHDIGVHVAFTKPSYLSRDDVPASEIDAERATIIEISRNEGKPEAAMDKIVEGRLNGWFKDRVVLEQPYVRDEKQTITQLLGDAKLVSFALVMIGS